VIVVKDEAVDRTVGNEHPVVVGTDGSSEAASALDFAGRHAARDGARLEVVTCTGGHERQTIDATEHLAAARRIATSAAERVTARHRRLTVTARVEDLPAEVAM
jgi:hypothetical protein